MFRNPEHRETLAVDPSLGSLANASNLFRHIQAGTCHGNNVWNFLRPRHLAPDRPLALPCLGRGISCVTLHNNRVAILATLPRMPATNRPMPRLGELYLVQPFAFCMISQPRPSLVSALPCRCHPFSAIRFCSWSQGAERAIMTGNMLGWSAKWTSSIGLGLSFFRHALFGTRSLGGTKATLISRRRAVRPHAARRP